jgi:Carboxypeptidase regulatory-like domain
VGVVTDADGGMLAGVTLTARNADTGMTRMTVTEADGKYRIAARSDHGRDAAGSLRLKLTMTPPRTGTGIIA